MWGCWLGCGGQVGVGWVHHGKQQNKCHHLHFLNSHTNLTVLNSLDLLPAVCWVPAPNENTSPLQDTCLVQGIMDLMQPVCFTPTQDRQKQWGQALWGLMMMG